MERNIKLIIAYDGAAYAGWQRQPAAQGISVQRKLEQAIGDILGHSVTLHGAGRTDAGVHAWGQVAAFRCDRPLPVGKMAAVINNLLPEDIRVREAWEAPPGFHPRFSPHLTTYRYLIEQGSRCSPFAGHYSWQLGNTLDIGRLRREAELLLGEHDFRHFTLTKASATNFVRRIESISIFCPAQPEGLMFPWQELASPLVIDVVGNGFLYKMVRLIVARLVAAGQGRLPEGALGAYLLGEVKANIPPAPASGLYLQEISYAEQA
ncbi:MAG: tRNA pseudouridine(38-40) synthase TruA [Clostridia bacterium]|nr:tRNA pseudouridine(38-40) synthase TruA [Clostridia bacterium]